jgi:hypothetical protein
MVIPNNLKDKANNRVLSIYTNSDQERYDVLTKIKSALMEWSGSSYWEGERFSDTAKIKYNNKLWILY